MSDTAPPIMFEWLGDGFKPATPRWSREADKYYVIGEKYVLVESRQRSTATHNHQFAAIEDAWASLPDELAERFPTAEHLRKYALIKAGFADSQSFTCTSRAEAVRLAAFIRPTDEFSVVTISEATVTRYTARSQSRKAMNAEDFQKSKTAILDIVSAMIGTSAQALEGAGRG